VVVAGETRVQRRRREQRRGLFDAVAELDDATRRAIPGYPAEGVDAVFANAAIVPGGAVLEIGCGTGQLTRQLAEQDPSSGTSAAKAANGHKLDVHRGYPGTG
jgi:ubiquinone/menaquinone biosynthesis C-methylase UbiE